ncbi:MAG: semialdehyde dehydrogenase, partial [Bacteroidales bacterium]|nr:semialdehyde dehydrogenase [Bacteroidales bacterium]
MKTLVIGATGAVGKDLVQQLIDDSSVERVDIFVRREVKISAPKLVVHVI